MSPENPDSAQPIRPGLSEIRLEGFKSFRDPTVVPIRNLTVFVGQNSAGKSTVMQPLLLAKQTLESPSTPEGLLLAGPCLRVSTSESLLWRGASGERRNSFSMGVTFGDVKSDVTWVRGPSHVLVASESEYEVAGVDFSSAVVGEPLASAFVAMKRRTPKAVELFYDWKWVPDRLGHRIVCGFNGVEVSAGDLPGFPVPAARELTYLPGLRGSPRRNYPVLSSAKPFAGVFTDYAVSVLLAWQHAHDPRAEAVRADLATLGVTSFVRVGRLAHDDTEVEVTVGRLPGSAGSADQVNIADVGIGVSQALPIVIALHAADPGETVHIEQPELHLHPNAQARMGRLLVAAANRGVRVIVETHSSVLLTVVQTAVARGDLAPDDLSLCWFTRDEDGASKVTVAEVGADGSYGPWPVDFADLELKLDAEYIEAASSVPS